MNKYLLIIAIIFLPIALFGQEETKNKTTKYDLSYLGSDHFRKFIDTKMDDFTFNGTSNLKCKVRVFDNGKDKSFYYMMVPTGTIPKENGPAFIEYSDLVEINKAYFKLLREVLIDRSKEPDYLENIFITDDGFSFGYYIEKSKVTWVLYLKSGASILILKKYEEFAKHLQDAQKKIESLMEKNGK